MGQITKCFKIIHYYYSITKSVSLKVSEMYRVRSKQLDVAVELVISKGYLDILKILLASANQDQEWSSSEQLYDYEDSNGNNLLHIAVINEQLPILKVLMKDNIDPSKVNKFNQTPYQIAYENGLMEICSEL